METETKGLCIRATDYGETDKLLTVVTPDRGKLTVKARGVRQPKAKMKAGASPLCFADYTFSEGRGLTLVGVRVIDNFFNCWSDVTKNACAMLVVELLDKTTAEGEEIGNELVCALKALSAINYGEEPLTAVTVYFTKLLTIVGEDALSELPRSERELFVKANAADLQDLSDFKAGRSELCRLLTYLNQIAKNDLGVNAKVFSELLALL